MIWKEVEYHNMHLSGLSGIEGVLICSELTSYRILFQSPDQSQILVTQFFDFASNSVASCDRKHHSLSIVLPKEGCLGCSQHHFLACWSFEWVSCSGFVSLDLLVRHCFQTQFSEDAVAIAIVATVQNVMPLCCMP